jgi:eukaryotic-like serine/threonine-protein kinase
MHRSLAASLLLLCPAAHMCPFAHAKDAAPPSRGADAPAPAAAMFRGDAAHTGVYSAAGTTTFHKVKWRFPTKAQVLSSPTVSGSTVYFGSNDHRLYAVDLETGEKKWEFKTDGRVASSPAVSNGLVYFLSYDSNFYAVDGAAGTLKWKFKTEGERRFVAKHLHGVEPASEPVPDPFDFYLSSPVFADGAVFFGSGDSNVYALDATTGGLKWKFKTSDVVHASPAFADGTLFVGSWDTYFYALDAATGREKWRFKTGEDHEIYNQTGLQASPAVSDGVVYFGCRDSKFYAVDVKSGKQIWAFSNKGSWVINSAAIRDGKVYFATSDTGLLRALDAKSGAEVFTLDFNHWPMFSSPAIAGNMMYLGSHQGRLLAVDLTSQKLAWYFETDAAKKNGPALTNDKGAPKYEAAFADNFYDDIVVGLQKMLSVGAVLSSPTIAGDTLLFGSTDGNLYAVQ